MEISEAKLREMIQRVLNEIEKGAGNTEAVRTGNLYVCCLKEWDDRYVRFLNDMKIPGHLKLCPLILPEWKANGYQALLERRAPVKAAVYEEMNGRVLSESDLTVFPVVPPELAAKTALGISDTPEIRWIISCMEQGSRIVFAGSGFRKFTGKEPRAYRDRIMSYYRILLEYGIGIRDGAGIFEASVLNSGSEDGKTGTVNGVAAKPGMKHPAKQTGEMETAGMQVTPGEQAKEKHKRKVITSADVEKYQVDGEIVLYPGDQITDIAKDRAKFLKITLIRA